MCRAGRSGPADPVLAGPLFHSSKKKKKKFITGFDQCGFTAWQRKSSKYSNNAATVTPVLLQRTSDNRSSMVSSTGLGVLHCGAGMRSRLGCGSARTHNACSVTTCTPKSTRYTKYSPPIPLYYTIAYVYTCIYHMYIAYARFMRTACAHALAGPLKFSLLRAWCEPLMPDVVAPEAHQNGCLCGNGRLPRKIRYIYSTKCIEQCMQVIQAWE